MLGLYQFIDNLQGVPMSTYNESNPRLFFTTLGLIVLIGIVVFFNQPLLERHGYHSVFMDKSEAVELTNNTFVDAQQAKEE